MLNPGKRYPRINKNVEGNALYPARLPGTSFGLRSPVSGVGFFEKTVFEEEFVADTPDGLNKLVGGIFNFTAQSSHMDIDGSGAAVIFITPDFA